ncbi:MAG: ABC transporter permease, partial [Acidobacteria bacterium]|nr:ABC transporter permease [Acidobacteriota bacterium]
MGKGDLYLVAVFVAGKGAGMRPLRAFFLRLGNVFQKERRERELAEELESTLQMHIDENLRLGMNPEEARYAALRSFGGVEQTKEECRDARGLLFLETLLQDLRIAVRGMRKSPGFTFVVVLTLALGIGANAAIFSVINSVLLRPLPFEDPERLVTIWHHYDKLNLPRATISPRTFAIYRDQTRSFQQVAALRAWNTNMTGRGNPERLQGMLVSDGFFSVLGVHPAMGRVFLPGEDELGHNRVVVLSDSFWKIHFGSDQAIVGKSITLNGGEYEVVGVMPPRFEFPREVELWTPMAFTSEELSSFVESLTAVARLKEGVSIQQAQAEMDTLPDLVRETYPNAFKENNGWGIDVISLHDVLVGNVRPALVVLLAAVGFVLLIACANVANLLLARGTVRKKEIAIRTAVGALRSRLVRQLLTESLLLGLLSGGLGLLIAFWGVGFLIKMTPADLSQFLPNWDTVGIDRRVMIFTFAISAVTTLIFGLAPALHASKTDLNEALQEGGRNAIGGGRSRVRSFLVVSEIALALVLLVGAGLLLRSFLRLQEVNPGFRGDNVLTMLVSLST